MVDPEATFSKPKFFEDRLSEVKRRIAQLSVKTNTPFGNESSPGGLYGNEQFDQQQFGPIDANNE